MKNNKLLTITLVLLIIGNSSISKAQIAIHLPLRNIRVTSKFGPRIHPITKKASLHNGVDLAARSDPIYSILKSRVSATGSHPLLGKYVKTKTKDIIITYGHLSRILVHPGNELSPGSPIAISGKTGRVTGEHLHLSVKYKDCYLCPIEFLIQAAQQNMP